MGKKSKIKYKTPSAGLTAMAAPTQISGIRSSIGLDTPASDLYQIRIELLVPYRNQARKHFDEEEISALAATIKEFCIRNPLTVIKNADDDTKYEVISGERRLRAAMQIGLSKVPCIILSDRSKANEVALIENVQRSDLHPIEVAQAYQALLDSNTYTTQQEIAEKISVKKSQVSESLKLNILPEEIKQHLITNNINREIFFESYYPVKLKMKWKTYLKLTILLLPIKK